MPSSPAVCTCSTGYCYCHLKQIIFNAVAVQVQKDKDKDQRDPALDKSVTEMQPCTVRIVAQEERVR